MVIHTSMQYQYLTPPVLIIKPNTKYFSFLFFFMRNLSLLLQDLDASILPLNAWVPSSALSLLRCMTE